MAAESIHAEWISPVREWIENMIRLAEDENISEDDFFEQLQNGLKSLPETRDDIFIDRLWDLQANGFKAGWEADWDEETVLSGKCRAKDPATCPYHNRGRSRSRRVSVKQWHKAKKWFSRKQNYLNVRRGVRWAVNNKSDVNDICYRKEVGFISIPYGSTGSKKGVFEDGYGLSKILRKHGNKAINIIPEMLVYGTIENHPSGNIDKRMIKYKNHEMYLTKRPGLFARPQKNRAWIITNYNPDDGLTEEAKILKKRYKR